MVGGRGHEQQSHASFPVFQVVGEPQRNALEKALSLFADVRAGEGSRAVMLTGNVFLLMAAYYLLKTAREPLILTEGTAEVKTYSSAAQALLLAGLIPLYGMLATRLGRGRLLTVTSLFFFANLVVFWALGNAGVREGVAYYIWVGVFNTFVISQFWQFANDLFSESQGKRLFPMIGVGSSVGAWGGAYVAGKLSDSWSPYTFMVVGAGMLLVCLAMTLWVNRHPAANTATVAPMERAGGFQLVMRERYLLYIALIVLALNVANTSGEYLLSKLVVADAEKVVGAGAEFAKARRAYIGQFYGDYFAWVNLVGFLLQTFVVSRLFRHINVSGTLYVLPLIALCGYSLLAFLPVLAIVRIAKIAENASDYSINNTARQALFLTTSREAKYKAKAAIDTFFMRGGDVLAAGVVFAATTLGLGLSTFAAVVAGVVVVWLFIVAKVARMYVARQADSGAGTAR